MTEVTEAVIQAGVRAAKGKLWSRGYPEGVEAVYLAMQSARASDPSRELLAGIKWKSADRDNMEFSARITYVQMVAIRAALAQGQSR